MQRQFTKRLFGLKDLTYKERLVRLNLPSLELCRLHLDLILCYKIVFGLVCVNFDDFFTFSPSSQTRGHSHKLYKPRCTNSVSQNFFCSKSHWCLELFTTDSQFSSLSLFKRSLKNTDFTPYMKCSVLASCYLCVFLLILWFDFMIWFDFNLFQLPCYSRVCVFSLGRLPYEPGMSCLYMFVSTLCTMLWFAGK